MVFGTENCALGVTSCLLLEFTTAETGPVIAQSCRQQWRLGPETGGLGPGRSVASGPGVCLN